MNRKSKKPAKREGARGNLFEFFRVLDNSITDTKRTTPRVDPCDPPHYYATRRTLGQVCADTYATGNFVALQVGENAKRQPEGLPRSYWVIKVKHGRAPVFEEVFPDDAMLRACRQMFIPDARMEGVDVKLGDIKHDAFYEFSPPDDDRYAHLFEPYRLQRCTEASIVANLFLKTVRDPEFKEMTPHEYARHRYAEGAERKEIAIELMEKYDRLKTDFDGAVNICNNALRPKQRAKKKRRDKQPSKAKTQKRSRT